jgi:predicted metallopeptidase
MGWTYTIHDGEIDIEIDKNLSFQDKILTLCHEMVHAWQFSQGRESNEEEAMKLEKELYNKYKEERCT